MRAPGELTGFCVVRAEITAYAILSGRDADDYLVMHHQRSGRHGFTQLWISVPGGPKGLTRLRVQGVKVCIQRRDKKFSVGISDAAVHDIAAGHRRGELILLRSELPDYAPNVIEVDGINKVWVGALKVHHVA